ncbi:MAG: LysR family transcriptional regulator [Geminicoccaceae bacterium]
MDWDGYRFLVAVANMGSLSAAARHLGTSQPTVGRRITDLESELKARLFQKSSDGYAPTSIGQAVIDRARSIEALVHDIERIAAGHDQRLSGKVTLSTTESLATFWLAAKLPLIRQRYPNVTVKLLTSTIKQDLMRGEADVALRIGDPGSPDLVGRKVGAFAFGLFGARSYLDQHGEPVDVSDLKKHDVIEPVGSIADFVQNRRWRELIADRPAAVSCDHTLGGLAAIRSGMGLFPLPLLAASYTPTIKRVLTEDFNVILDLWLLTHRDLRETARIRAVIDLVVEQVRGDRQLFTGNED